MRQMLRYVILGDSGEDIQTAVNEGLTAEVEIPQGAELMPGIGVTSKGIVVYAIADRDSVEDAPTQTREFYICGNGVDLPEGATASTFRDTFKPGPGSFTLHVFDIVKVPAAN